MFATEVGQQEVFPGGGNVTAIGTMNIHQDGNVSGEFDTTVAGFGFLPNNPYTGFMTVDHDCRGTLMLENSAGMMRTDSIVVLNTRGMWAMVQDPSNLLTYRVRRISRHPFF